MKTGRTAPKLPLSCKTLDLHKTLNIRKVLLPLDGRNGIYGASKVREDKADRPVLDVEEVTVLPSTNIRA